MDLPYKSLCAAFGSLLACVSSAQAERDDVVVDRITVTGSAIEDRFRSPSTEPASAVTIDAGQIEQQHARNLIEVLRSVPGVTADLQGDGETIKIKLRGIENQRFRGEKPGVAVVVDGVPVFERTGKVNLDIDNIESVRVLRGGASYLYGEDALAGAVIVTTRRGAGQKGLALETDHGSFGYHRSLARAGFASDRFSGHLQYSDRDQDGYYFLSRTWAKTWSGSLQYALDASSDLRLGFERSERFRDREGAVTGETAARLDPTGRDEGRGYTRNFNVDLTRLNLSYSKDFDERTNLLAVAYQYQDDTTFWSAPMRFDAAGRPTTNVNDYSTFNDYAQVQRGVKTEYRASFERFALMGGIDLRRNRFENQSAALAAFRNTPFGPVTATGTLLGDDRTNEDTRAVYGEAKFAIAQATAATLNLRRDLVGLEFDAQPVVGNGNRLVEQRRSFGVNSYRAGITHALDASTSLFGAVSTGFRLPTAEQLYRGQTTTNALVLGNPDLAPEKATTFEAGVSKRAEWFGWPARIGASVFQIDRDDFILDSNGEYAALNTPIGGGSQFRNIGGARSRGIELGLNTEERRGWSFGAAFTLLDAHFTRYDNFFLGLGNANGRFVANPTAAQRTDPAFWRSHYTVQPHDNTGNRVPRTPARLFNVRAQYVPAPGWSIDGEVDHRSDSYADEINQERLPGRTLLHLATGYATKVRGVPGARLSFFARIENVLDKRYYVNSRGTGDSNFDGRYDREDPSIVPDPGRTWRVGLSLRY